MKHHIIEIREEILKVMFNENSLKILNQIIANNDNLSNNLLITTLNLTRKQFYTNLNELITRGLIKKEKGIYYITTFGKVVYDMTTEYKKKLDSIIEDYWKFKAIDLLDISDEFTKDERDKILNHLFHRTNSEHSVMDVSLNEDVPYLEFLHKNKTFKL